MSKPRPVCLRDEDREPARVYIRRRIDVNESGCWIWRGNKLHGGHGQGKWRRYPIKAHRLSYAAFVGEPGELNVLHTCDVPACCNPQHHFLGTKGDNNRDAYAKGRYDMRGQGMSVAECSAVILMRAAGVEYEQIAAETGFNRSTVQSVCTGQTRASTTAWLRGIADLSRSWPARAPSIKAGGRKRSFTGEVADQVIKARAAGCRVAEISARYGVSSATIYNLLRSTRAA